MAFLVARICAQNDRCVHPFLKRSLRAIVFTENQHSDPSIRNFGFDYWCTITEDGLDRRHL